MKFHQGDFPIWHPTFNVLDSTKLSTLQDCPRKFFYQYILGWRETISNIHLGFGSAWHDAVEVLMKFQDGNQVGYTPEQIAQASLVFNKTYQDKFALPSDKESVMSSLLGVEDTTGGAKTLDNGLTALAEYAVTYKEDNFRTLFTEISGSLPVNDEEDRVYFKLDSLIEEDGRSMSYEHKTTGRKTNSWLTNWPLRLQVGTYSYVLYTLYGPDNGGVIINGAVLRPPSKRTGKRNNEYLRIPAQLSELGIASWLSQLNYLIDVLKWNMNALAKTKPSDKVMVAFPRNDSSCSKFGCPFADICCSDKWANPVSRINDIPMGYKREYWDPRDRGRDQETGEKIRGLKEKSKLIEVNGLEMTGKTSL